MNKLQAIIFDVDGTIANTEVYGHLVAFNMAFQEFGLSWRWDKKLYGDLLKITGGKERIQFYIDQYKISFIGDQNTIIKLHQLKTKHYIELLKTGLITLRNGVKELIHSAKMHNITLAIATTTGLQNVIALLQNQLDKDAIKWFKVIGTSESVTNKKPAPDIYHFVLNQLKIKPENCIVIEDSSNGLLSAKQAKLKTIITTNEYTKDDNLTGADLVIDQIGTKSHPFTVIAGNCFADTYLSISLLDKILSNQSN